MPIRPITLAVMATTLAALPNLLLAGLAVLIQAEIGFGAFELGLAISVFILVSVTLAILTGVLSELVGPHRALVIGASVTAASLLNRRVRRHIMAGAGGWRGSTTANR